MTTYLSNTLVFYLPLRLLKYMTLRVIDQLKLNSFNLLLGVLLFSTSSYAAAADDFSDAPASYGAPTHTIAGALKLGTTAPDSELAAAPNATATGDDTTGVDDEDGIASFPTLYTGVTSYSLPLNRISATGTGTLHAWIDFNKDGVFSATEYKAVAVTSNVLADSLNWSGISVGSVGSTYARFRFTSTTLTDVAGTTPLDERSTMAAANGEVEDYALTIEPVPPIPPFCAPETLVDDGNFTGGTLTAGVWRMPSTSGWSYGNAPYDTSISNAYNYNNEANTFHNSDQTGGLYDAFNPAGNPTTGIRSVLQESDGATSAIIYRFPRALRPGVFNYAFDLSSRFNHTVFQDQYKVSLYNADTDTITAVLAQDFVDTLPTAAVETPKWKTLNGSVSVPSYGNYYLLFQIDPNLAGQNSDYMIDRIVFAGATCDTMDRADAPLSYGTPVHFLPSSLYLGATVDNDPGSLSPLDGSGDGTDDDGITSFPWLIAGATSYTIPAANLSATGTGTLYAWIDFNKDGAFTTTEQRSVTVTNGVLSGPLSWTGITVGSIGTTYARLRFTSTALADNATTTAVDERATLSATDGEVEDYALLIETLQDRGDAPATYGAPTHTLSGSLKLGANAPDSEGTLSSLNGLGDDTTGIDDEDGITFPILAQGQTATITATVAGVGGYLQGWIDWNGDGDFADIGEQVATNIQDNLGSDTNAATGTIAFNATVPLGATLAQTYARFRWSTTINLNASAAATSGEVEDYALTISTSKKISGIVFEDINYGGGTGRSQTTASGMGINGATVELYNNLGSLLATTTTANDGVNDGAYTFNSISAGDYYVRVVSDTINSTRIGSNGTELAVQTFRTDGTTPTTNEIGGRNPTLADGVANTGTETLNTTSFTLSGGSHVQSLQALTLATTDITGVNFGFNFDTIVNTNDTGQGSLRQFILNSNLLGGEASLAQAGSRKRLDNTNEPLPTAYESSIFMIPSSALTAGIAKIQIASSASLLPSVTGSNTILDATTQTTNIGDTNTGLLGTGGTVGVDALTLAKIPAPEIELFPAAAGYTYGIHLNNTGVVVRGFSAYGFGSDVNANGVIVVGSSGNGVIIEQNVLGTTASSFTAPALRGQGSTIQTGASGGFVLNNLIGFSGGNGLRMNGNTWTVKANEIRGNGAGSADGLWGYFGSNMTIEGNLITDSASGGYDGLYRSSFTNNTVTYNGRDTSSTEDYGVSVVGDGSLINRNIFTENAGQGVLVYNNVHPTTLNNWVSQNSMFANGKLGIDLVSTAGNTAGDNVSINDANDSDTGANRLLNFPQIREAHLNAGMLTLRGCASAGAIIELFEADVSPTSSSGVSAGANQLGRTQDYGEGERYLLTLTEGVGEDTTSNPVNCTNLTDSDNNNATGMNPFQWTIPLPTGLVLGDVLTATATLSGSGTSEFSAATLISQPLDYSDAPASYGNPAHLIVNGIHLGALAADNETSAMPTTNADGDDTTDSDDEDGVTLPTAFTTNQITSISVAVVGSGGQLQAWIDWNGDGDFADTGEKIAKNLADNTGIDTDATVGMITFNVTPPATAVNGNTYARFRWSTQSNLNSTLAANDGEVEDYAVQVVAGGTPLSIAGRVFNDLNVNGIDDNEAGLKDVVIVLENLTTGTCSSVKTTADGSYHFDDLTAGDYTVIEAVGAKLPSPTTCPPTAKDPNGFVSSTPNSLAITLASAAVNDADFGEVKAPLFSLDHSKVILPNSSINYPHTFQTYADGNVLFNITQEVADPNDLNWSTSLFLDTNCDAKLDQGDTPITSALAVSAGTKLCILAKVIAPANAPAGALHVLTVSSDFQYGDASLITASNIQTHTDRTQTSAETTPSSGEGKLSLEKSVWNVTRNIDGNVALPGETLRYTIYYENIGNGLLNELVVQDSVPEFTQLVPNSLLCDNTPPELTNCTPQVSGIGLEWVFLGQLKAGSKGQVSYQVIVE